LSPAGASIGAPTPLGATWDGYGTNFALASSHAERVELCLFASADAPSESKRFALPGHTDDVFHGYLKGVRPGQLYGYRVHGPGRPSGSAQREEALSIRRRARLPAPCAGTRRCSGTIRPTHGARALPTALLHAARSSSTPFDWGDDAPARAVEPRSCTECHVKG
jgi:hypothetical protein